MFDILNNWSWPGLAQKSELVPVGIWCLKYQKLFKTLIRSWFQRMHWCAHKTATLTSIQHTALGGGGHLPSPRFWKYFSSKWLMCTYFFVTRSPDFGPSDGTAIYHGAESGTKLSFQHKKELVKGSFSTNASIQNMYSFKNCFTH